MTRPGRSFTKAFALACLAVVAARLWKRVSATFLLALAIPLGLLNFTTSGTMNGIYASLAVLLAASS